MLLQDLMMMMMMFDVLQARLMSRSRSIADVVFQLKSLREDRHLQDLMDVHGILEVKKIANLSSLKPILGQEASTTYGFKATKRKFKIEVEILSSARLHFRAGGNADTGADY